MDRDKDGKPPSSVKTLFDHTHFHSLRVDDDSPLRRERLARYLCSPLATGWSMGGGVSAIGFLHIPNGDCSGSVD